MVVGTILGSHRILEKLGEGGMGEVYLAHDTKLNRRVAIKVLPDAYALDAERIARFHREAQAVAALNHPGIAAIHDLAEAPAPNGEPSELIRYLILELVEGETLAEMIKRGPLPIEDAIRIGRLIIEAVEFAHEKGICHRDLKPANIKITPDGQVKVLDFGLAKFMSTGAGVAAGGAGAPAGLTHSPTLSLAGTIAGVILGTAGYMSPEQAKGFDADHRSDVFAFGCILYEMLTGQQAFDGDSVSEILASVLKLDIDLTRLPPRLNPRLVETLKRCLEKNPKKRWQAIGDVRLELDAIAGRTVLADDTSSTGTTRPRGLRTALAVGIAIGAIVAGVIAGYAGWRMKPEAPRPIARFSIALPEGQQFTGQARRLVAISPDGSTLLYDANTSLWLRGISEAEPHLVNGTQGFAAISLPVFSPDGRFIAFVVPEPTQRLIKIPTAGGTPVTICDMSLGIPNGLTWDESGLVFAQPGQGILRVSSSGGSPEVIVRLPSDEVSALPQVLPGGKAVLFSVRKAAEPLWDKGQIVAALLKTGERRVLVEGATDGRYVPTGHLVYAVGGTLYARPMDADRLAVSDGPTPVVEGVTRPGSDSPGGAQFAFAGGTLAYIPGPAGTQIDSRELGIFDRQGGVQPLKLPAGAYGSPRASKDGTRIAMERLDQREMNVWTYQLSGDTAPQRLTFGGNNRAPVWSPDGAWIAFQSDREGDRAIFRQHADGSGTAERLTKPDKGVEHIPQSWSSDGRNLLFSAQTSQSDSRLFTLTLVDGKTSPYGDTTAREAAFSPDGRWIVYQTQGADGRQAAYVEPFPRTGAKYFVPVAGGHPYWSPKGNEIMMNVAATSSTVIPVTTGSSVTFGRPAAFPRIGRQEPNPRTDRRAADMLPDGEHVVGLVAAGGTDQFRRINVVLNWQEELKQRVPGGK